MEIHLARNSIYIKSLTREKLETIELSRIANIYIHITYLIQNDFNKISYNIYFIMTQHISYIQCVNRFLKKSNNVVYMYKCVTINFVKNFEKFRTDQPTTHKYFTRQNMVNKLKFFCYFIHRLNLTNRMFSNILNAIMIIV